MARLCFLFALRMLTMKQFDLFTNVLGSEEKAISYPRNIYRMKCCVPGEKNSFCDGRMRLRNPQIKNKAISKLYMCTKKKCRTSCIIRSINSFFSHLDKNGKPRNNLSLEQIIHFIYEWLYSTNTTKKMMIKTDWIVSWSMSSSFITTT